MREVVHRSASLGQQNLESREAAEGVSKQVEQLLESGVATREITAGTEVVRVETRIRVRRSPWTVRCVVFENEREVTEGPFAPISEELDVEGVEGGRLEELRRDFARHALSGHQTRSREVEALLVEASPRESVREGRVGVWLGLALLVLLTVVGGYWQLKGRIGEVTAQVVPGEESAHGQQVSPAAPPLEVAEAAGEPPVTNTVPSPVEPEAAQPPAEAAAMPPRPLPQVSNPSSRAAPVGSSSQSQQRTGARHRVRRPEATHETAAVPLPPPLVANESARDLGATEGSGVQILPAPQLDLPRIRSHSGHFTCREGVEFHVSPEKANVLIDGITIGVADRWDGRGLKGEVWRPRPGLYQACFVATGYRRLCIDLLLDPEGYSKICEIRMDLEAIER